MNGWDYLIIVVYAGGLLGLGYFFKDQKDSKDYFLGGRSFGWFPIGLSIMASQLSAISFISAAAFVGIREGGGMMWLSYEFAVPLAMIFLIVIHIPPLYKSGVVSIYGFLEDRFNSHTRLLISLVFQFSRAFASGIMIYAVSLVLSTVLGIAEWQTILLAGGITLVYSFQGGMKAVVWGDAVQMVILVVGIFVCIGYGLHHLGGWDTFVAGIEPERLKVINWDRMGVGEDDGGFGFWPMLLGGFFLYTSYYGCDQSEAQRPLSAANMGVVRKALLFSGVSRFPITLSYCLMGLVVGTFAMQEPSFHDMIPADKPDMLMPLFIANYLPNGIMGLLIVAILAAAMSSLSSAINSLSAASTQDIVLRLRKNTTTAEELKFSKWLSLFWGTICIILAFSANNIADTVIEAINKVGSVFYGPIFAIFFLAIVSKRVKARAANIGLLVGVSVNLFLWLYVGDQLFWFWWNLTGTVSTVSAAYIASLLLNETPLNFSYLKKAGYQPLTVETIALMVFFVLMLGFSIYLSNL